MEYTVSQLANLSGVSARTLRYYDEINLLIPNRVNSNGYRLYSQKEVDLLQQILFYRELDISLAEIKKLIYAEAFDVTHALKEHHVNLTAQRERLDALIATVEKTIKANEGELEMADQEKFQAFKKETIVKNEEKYGQEIRENYGDKTVDQSNQKLLDMTDEEWVEFQALDKELNSKLAEATKQGDPESDLAQKVAELHKEWLTFTWPDSLYDKEKHYNLSLMYVQDDRFKAYYEKIIPGAAEFLHEALKIYLNIK